MPACASFFKHISANNTRFASVRSIFGRSNPSREIGANEFRPRSNIQSSLALRRMPSAFPYHMSSNSWPKTDPDNFDSPTQMVNPSWPGLAGSIEAYNELPENESFGYTGGQAADVEEECCDRRTNVTVKSISVNIKPPKFPEKK